LPPFVINVLDLSACRVHVIHWLNYGKLVNICHVIIIVINLDNASYQKMAL